MWYVYGFDFSASQDHTMRYAVMAYITTVIARKCKQQIHRDFYKYLSHFYKGIGRAIENNTIDETHLFALFYGVISTWMYTDRETAVTGQNLEAHVHLKGFLAVLEHLSPQISTSGSGFPSHLLWRFSLSFFRRSLDVYLMNLESINDLRWSMHTLDRKLWRNVDNIEVSEQIFGYSDRNHSACVNWDTRDVFHSLMAASCLWYRNRYYGSAFVGDDLTVEETVDAISNRYNGFEKLHSLEKEYEVTPSNMETEF
jgi:hypothetical protein